MAAASMWDDGPDPVAALAHTMAVRKIALTNFGEGVLLPHEPLAHLRRKFVPVWLLHRYDVEAAVKLIGGIEAEYKVRGDNQPLPRSAPPNAQRAALDGLIATLDSGFLTVPGPLVPLLSVPITQIADAQFEREVFANAGASVFDPLVAADVAADLTLDALLAPVRLRRLVDQSRRDPALPGVSEVVDSLMTRVVARRGDPVARQVAWRAIMALAAARADPATMPEAAAIIDARLASLQAELAATRGAGEAASWARYVARVLGDDAKLAGLLAAKGAKPVIPPGMPIGGSSGWHDD
jgi:hypothetical protein